MKLIQCIFFLFVCCTQTYAADTTTLPRFTKKVTYGNATVDVLIEKPEVKEADVLILYHGTVLYDKNSLQAASTTLDKFKSILDRKDMLLVSVAYTGENMLLGDNIVQAEAALLWVKNKATQELGITVKRVFLAGHSQGGYLVTRLNTMHETNGVIANAPGPLDLTFRCQQEENGKIASSIFCTNLRKAYGTTSINPDDYMKRSLLNFTTGFKSDILFVQGLDDTPIHLHSWPLFKERVRSCSDCKSVQIAEVPGGEHGALFTDPAARTAFNQFIRVR